MAPAPEMKSPSRARFAGAHRGRPSSSAVVVPAAGRLRWVSSSASRVPFLSRPSVGRQSTRSSLISLTPRRLPPYRQTDICSRSSAEAALLCRPIRSTPRCCRAAKPGALTNDPHQVQPGILARWLADRLHRYRSSAFSTYTVSVLGSDRIFCCTMRRDSPGSTNTNFSSPAYARACIWESSPKR
jgi:hypothetical protein